MAEQHLKLEQYVESVRRALGAAQRNADGRQNVRVTVDHLLAAMLEAGMGEDPCKRAGVETKSLLAKATAALDALPTNATALAFLDAELLATMARAEAVAKQLGAPLVDIQCMYVALGARKHLPSMIGLGKWSDTERIGYVPPAPAAAPPAKEPTLSAALGAAAAGFAGVGAQIAAACGVPMPPPDVKATFERILLAFHEERTPLLSFAWRKRGDTPPTDFRQALVATRDGHEGRSVVVTWAPPATMVLETTDESGIQSVPFELTPAKRWVSGERELFGALRAAILGLYAEVGAVNVPAPAKSDTYVVADGVGTLKLATGQPPWGRPSPEDLGRQRLGTQIGGEKRMEEVDGAARNVTLDVVVWGPEGSGKSTLVRQLAPSELSSPPVRGFDFVTLKLGPIGGLDVTVKLHGTAGRDDAETRARRADPMPIDGVIFVADSRPDRMPANEASMAELREMMERSGLDDIGRVIVFNKRDLADAASEDQMADRLGAESWNVLSCVATSGVGVRDALKVIVKASLAPIFARLERSDEEEDTRDEDEIEEHCFLPLPEGWALEGRDGDVVAYRASGGGVLQMSQFPAAVRGHSPRRILESTTGDNRLGPTVEGPCAYGNFALARLASSEYGDVRMWCLCGDLVPPLLATWVGDTGAFGSAEVDSVVQGAVGIHAATNQLANVIRNVRAAIVRDGVLTQAAYLLGDALFKQVEMPFLHTSKLSPVALQMIRTEVAAHLPAAVAIVTFAVTGENRTALFALETPAERVLAGASLLRGQDGRPALAEAFAIPHEGDPMTSLRGFF